MVIAWFLQPKTQVPRRSIHRWVRCVQSIIQIVSYNCRHSTFSRQRHSTVRMTLEIRQTFFVWGSSKTRPAKFVLHRCRTMFPVDRGLMLVYCILLRRIVIAEDSVAKLETQGVDYILAGWLTGSCGISFNAILNAMCWDINKMVRACIDNIRTLQGLQVLLD